MISSRFEKYGRKVLLHGSGQRDICGEQASIQSLRQSDIGSIVASEVGAEFEYSHNKLPVSVTMEREIQIIFQGFKCSLF